MNSWCGTNEHIWTSMMQLTSTLWELGMKIWHANSLYQNCQLWMVLEYGNSRLSGRIARQLIDLETLSKNPITCSSYMGAYCRSRQCNCPTRDSRSDASQRDYQVLMQTEHKNWPSSQSKGMLSKSPDTSNGPTERRSLIQPLVRYAFYYMTGNPMSTPSWQNGLYSSSFCWT